VRFHLLPSQRVVAATLDGHAVTSAEVLRSHIHPLPLHRQGEYFPFGGVGTSPAPSAGCVAEFHLDWAAELIDGPSLRLLSVRIQDSAVNQD
jgi:hypothetical protein